MDFDFLDNEDGLLLKIHNTFVESNTIKRANFRCACFDAEANNFVIADSRGLISIFNFSSKKYHPLESDIHKITTIQCAPDNKRAILGTSTGALVTLSFETDPKNLHFEPLSTFKSKVISIESNGVCFVAYSAFEATLFEWSTLQHIKKLEFSGCPTTSAMNIIAIKFVPNTDMILGMFSNNMMHLWTDDLTNIKKIDVQKKVQRFLQNSDTVQIDFGLDGERKVPRKWTMFDVEITPDGQYAFILTSDGYLIQMSIERMEMCAAWEFNSCNVVSVKLLSCETAYIVSIILTDQSVVILNLTQHKSFMLLPGVSGRFLKTSSNGEYLAIKTKELEILLYNSNALVDHLSIQSTSLYFPSKGRLKRLLVQFGVFPEEYRPMIWRHLLKLPHNTDAYKTLLSTSDGRSFTNLKEPLRSICQCIGNWCPIFRDWAHTPTLIKPFLRLFGNKGHIDTVETVLTLLLNHGQLWMEFWPKAPINYIGLVENILKFAEPQLLQYYSRKGLNVGDLTMPMVGSAMSNIVNDFNWAHIFDHVFVNDSWFLVFVLASFHSIHKMVLMKLENVDSVKSLFTEMRPINVKLLIERSYELAEMCRRDIHPMSFMKPFEPLNKGYYRLYENYPHELVAVKEQTIDRLRDEYRRIEEKMIELERADAARIREVERCLIRDEHLKRIKASEKHVLSDLHSVNDVINGKRLLLAMRDEQNKNLETYTEPFNAKRPKYEVTQDVMKANLSMAEDLSTMCNYLENQVKKAMERL